jgi:hypothetical protein
MIIGELATGVRILLEKGTSRHQISEDQQFQGNTQKFIYCQKTKVAGRRLSERSSRGATPPGDAGPPLAAPPWGEATLAHFCHCPLTYIVFPENLSRGGIRDRHRRLCEAKNTEREKLSGRQKSAREIPSRRGEIVAIVITIALGFIGIIIITSTFISTITMPSRCNILG